MSQIFIGTAGWTIPRSEASHFRGAGSHLERYAGVFSGCEINSTFYRPPLASTLQRWADTTPAHFRFALKLPKAISHERRLVGCEGLLDAFLTLTEQLGDKRGPLLLQLPPSFAWNETVAAAFFDLLRARYAGPLALEPRHASWFTPAVSAGLQAWRIARVAADPPRIAQAAAPGGDPAFAYFRWHGSPRVYYSPYDCEALAVFAQQITACGHAAQVWCIFDNTASGAAAANARELAAHLEV